MTSNNYFYLGWAKSATVSEGYGSFDYIPGNSQITIYYYPGQDTMGTVPWSGWGTDEWIGTKVKYCPATGQTKIKIYNSTHSATTSYVNKSQWGGSYGLGVAGVGVSYHDDYFVSKSTTPEPTYTVGAERTSPKIERINVGDVDRNEEFLLSTTVYCLGARCGFEENNITLELPSGFSVPNDKIYHAHPEIATDKSWQTTWSVTAPDSTGWYLLNVSGPLNKKTFNLTVDRNILDIRELIQENTTEEHTNTRDIIKTNLTEEHSTTKDVIKTNLTKEHETTVTK